ncbi:MAG: nucleotide exchange factor GrpE [Actinomycetota bacterium]
MPDRPQHRPDSGGGEPLGSSPVTKGVPSEDPRGSSGGSPEAPPESTPLVDEGGAEGVSPEGSSASPGDVEGRAAEYLDDLRRLKAEFENYRKRVLREQTLAVELAAEPLMAKLLEVLDEFELALMAAERKPDFDRFLHGVELVYAKLTDILRSEGLERIDADDAPFDPGRHEALLQAEGESDGEPYVADVLRPGYTLKGRVIRPAGVKVGRR